MLGLIDLTGALVTGDALHCQGEIAGLIKDRGGYWLFTLKANRPVQYSEGRAWFADPLSRPVGEHTTTDADNGRIEVRRHAVTHDISWSFPIAGIRTKRRCRAGHARHGGINRNLGR